MFALDKALSDLVNINRPSNIDFIYYLFWERGISIIELSELPIPYIFCMLNTHKYIKEEEAKAMKKASKK